MPPLCLISVSHYCPLQRLNLHFDYVFLLVREGNFEHQFLADSFHSITFRDNISSCEIENRIGPQKQNNGFKEAVAPGKRAAHVLAINLWIGLPRLTTTATLQVRPNYFAEDNFGIPNNHSRVQSFYLKNI